MRGVGPCAIHFISLMSSVATGPTVSLGLLLASDPIDVRQTLIRINLNSITKRPRRSRVSRGLFKRRLRRRHARHARHAAPTTANAASIAEPELGVDDGGGGGGVDCGGGDDEEDGHVDDPACDEEQPLPSAAEVPLAVQQESQSMGWADFTAVNAVVPATAELVHVAIPRDAPVDEPHVCPDGQQP